MRRSNSKLKGINLISIIFFLLAAVFYLVNERYPFLSAQQGNEGVLVATIHDGDTISVILHKKREKLRLIGIDAPETGQNPWGAEAKQYLESVVQASKWKVTIETDAEKTDQYGRILAYVWTADGRFINLEMIKSGYAMLYTVPPNVKYAAEFKKAQAEAREKRLGIWSENGLREKPHDYRKEHPRI